MSDKLPYTSTFKDLLAYRKAMILAERIYTLTKQYPKEELYSLTDQIRRSSRSVGAQIAEAWGKRRYINHFILMLTNASVELNETERWLDISNNCAYLSDEFRDELIKLCQKINGLVGGMISKASLFCEQ
ncbi:MAG: four helix bundle protein [Anaerolineales bacterium]|nr:four helix bundle protein [Anaerolineales bacterium]